jgi:hypothetical protein
VSFVDDDMGVAVFAVVASLGDDGDDVAVSAVDVAVSGAVDAAAEIVYTEAAFLVLSHHFFFWPRLPCPGPGMLVVGW